MASSRIPTELKNCKLENPSLLFGHLAQYLKSDMRRVLSPYKCTSQMFANATIFSGNTHTHTHAHTHTHSVLVGLPLGLIGRLDRVLRSAARLIGHIPKYASVSAYMRDVLHWLPVSQGIL